MGGPEQKGLVVAGESLRGYLQLASGLSEVTRAKATEAAHAVLSLSPLPAVSGVAAGVSETSGKLAGQVAGLAEEIMAAAATNRETIAALVRSEVDAAVQRLGLVPAQDLDRAEAEVARLRAEVTRLKAAATPAAAPATAAARKAPARKAPAKKSPAKTVTATKATAKRATAKRATAKKATAKKATAQPEDQ